MSKTISTILEEFDKKIQERTLNKDNPQYVLGWNACRYLSKQFFCQSIESMNEDRLNEFIRKGWHEIDCPAHSNQMRREKDCTCLYGFVIELLGGKII